MDFVAGIGVGRSSKEPGLLTIRKQVGGELEWEAAKEFNIEFFCCSNHSSYDDIGRVYKRTWQGVLLDLAICLALSLCTVLQLLIVPPK